MKSSSNVYCLIRVSLFSIISLATLIHCSPKKGEISEKALQTKHKIINERTTYESLPTLTRVAGSAHEIDATKALPISFEEFNNQYVDSAFFIALSDEEMIGAIDKVLFSEGRIYILDRFLAKKVFIFSMEGDFIRAIDDLGNGPNEYSRMSNIFILPDTKQLVIEDNGGLNYLYYTLDGEFISMRKTTPGLNSFPGKKNISYHYVGYKQLNSKTEKHHLLIASRDSIMCYTDFPYLPIQKSAPAKDPFYLNELGELLFNPTLSDTIYQIYSDTLYRSKYVVKQAKSIWERRNEELDNEEQTDLIRNGYTALSSKFIETDQFCSFCICKFRRGQFPLFPYYYNKKSGKLIYFDYEKAFNGNFTCERGIVPYASPIGYYNGYFVATFLPQPIAKGDKKMHPEYRQIMENAKEDSNPVLFFYKLN